VIVLKTGAVATPEELVSLVKERKGPLHAPKSVRFVQSLPLTSLGKVDKKALRQSSSN